MQRIEISLLLFKAFMAWLVWSCLAWYFGLPLLTLLFPLLKAVMIHLQPNLAPSLNLLQSTDMQTYTLELSALVLKPLYLNASHSIPKGTELKASAQLLHVLVPFVIEATVLSVWPLQHFYQRLQLLLLGFFSSILVVLALLPAQLLGNLEIALQQIAENGLNPRTVPWFVDWLVFCEMGGRWLLAISCAWLCIQVQRNWLSK